MIPENLPMFQSKLLVILNLNVYVVLRLWDLIYLVLIRKGVVNM